jgi:hypothetical protein
MDETINSRPEDACKAIFGELEMVLLWKWDSRFDTFLAEFDAGSKEGVRAVLTHHLSNVWDRSNITRAPAAVQRINNDLGGLLSGQMLFTSDLKEDAFTFCAWWPWGDGKTISIRVAPSYQKWVDPERNKQIQSLRKFLSV